MCQTKWNLEDWSFATTILFQIITFLLCFVFLYQIVLQKLRIYCDPQQSERETACEIYSVVRLVCWFVVGLASQVVHHQKLVCVNQLGVSIFFLNKVLKKEYSVRFQKKECSSRTNKNVDTGTYPFCVNHVICFQWFPSHFNLSFWVFFLQDDDRVSYQHYYSWFLKCLIWLVIGLVYVLCAMCYIPSVLRNALLL